MRIDVAKFLADKHIRSHVILLAVIAVGAVLSFAMFALAARLLGPERFGHFATVFNALALLSVVATVGQETLIGRSWNEYAGNARIDLAGGALIFGLRYVMIGAIAAAASVCTLGTLLGLTAAASLAAASLVAAQTVLCFTTGASRAIAGPVASTGQYEITWRLATILAVLLAAGAAYPMDEPGLILVLTGGMAVAAGLQTYLSYRALPPGMDWSRLTFRREAWRRRSIPMWGAALLEAGSQYADVILIGVIIDPVSAGAYFAATRIANAFAKVTLAASDLAGSRVSLLYFSRPRAELQAFLRPLALSTGALVVAGLSGIFLLGPLLLAVFGSTYAGEFWTLAVLSLGTATVALFGPAPYLLLHTGHEGLYTRTIAVGLLVRLLLFIVLSNMLGSLGAALAFTIVAAAVCVALNRTCRRHLGIDPSVFSLMLEVPTGDHAGRPVPAWSAMKKARRTRPRLLLLQTQAENGGAQEIARILGSGLEKRGFEVHFAFFYRRTDCFDSIANTFFAARRRPAGLVEMTRMAFSLCRHIKALEPDAVFTFQHYGNVVGATVAQLAGARRVIANQNSCRASLPFWVLSVDWLLTATGAYTQIIANSASTKAEFGRLFGPLRWRILRIDHGFEPKLSPLSKTAARGAIGLPERVIILGSVGRLHPEKNHRAVIALLPNNPHWHVAFAGQGHGKADLETMALVLGCRDRVHFVGELPPDRIGTFLKALDVFVFPSKWETFGLAAVEAAHVGVPVVCHHLDVMREVLKVDGQSCADFVDVDDRDALEEAVRRVLGQAGQSHAFADRGRRLQRKYSVDRMVDRYAAVLRRTGVRGAV